MNKHILKSFLIIWGLGIIHICSVYGQNRMIKGIVEDSSGQAVWAATVVCYKADSSIIAQGITNERGAFVLRCDYSGEGNLLVRHICYKPVYMKMALPLEDTLRILLEEQFMELEEVSVQGSHPLVEVTKEGNLCYNCGTLNAKSG